MSKPDRCPVCGGGPASCRRRIDEEHRRFYWCIFGALLIFALGVVAYGSFFAYEDCSVDSPCLKVRHVLVRP